MNTPRTPDRLSAHCHTVEVAWRLLNTRRLVVGPEPRLVLAVRARKDVELLTLKVDYPELGHSDRAGALAEAVLAEVPHVWGLRRLSAEGDGRLVWGQEDVAAAAMMPGGKPEDRAGAPEQIQWWGGAVRWPIELNQNYAPCIFWAWRGRVLVPKGASVGVIVRSSVPTVCYARMAGI